MRAAIHGGLLRDQHQVRADAPGLIDHHDVFDACGLRLTRTGDDAGLAAFIGNDADRSPAKPWVKLLFYAGKKAVKVEIEVFNSVRSAHCFAESGGTG